MRDAGCSAASASCRKSVRVPRRLLQRRQEAISKPAAAVGSAAYWGIAKQVRSPPVTLQARQPCVTASHQCRRPELNPMLSGDQCARAQHQCCCESFGAPRPWHRQGSADRCAIATTCQQCAAEPLSDKQCAPTSARCRCDLCRDSGELCSLRGESRALMPPTSGSACGFATEPASLYLHGYTPVEGCQVICLLRASSDICSDTPPVCNPVICSSLKLNIGKEERWALEAPYQLAT
jgi:hypothetical protein